MLAKLEQSAVTAGIPQLKGAGHVLLVLPRVAKLEALRDVPFTQTLAAALQRRKKKLDDLAKSPIATDLPGGALAVWAMLDPGKPVFERQTLLRKAVVLALAEKPDELAIAVYGTAAQRLRAAELA